jgi:hypothetical protein
MTTATAAQTVEQPKEKYRTDLFKLWPTDSERFLEALAHYAATDLRLKFTRRGSVLYHNRRISKTGQAQLRAFAHGLATANYDVE